MISRLNSLQNGYAEVFLKGHHTAHVPLECLSLVDPDKITPGSTVRVSSVQNISVDVLGEGRTINVSAGQVVDWFDDKSSHTPTSETSRLMSVRLRQAIRRLFDLEKRLQCPGKDAPDHEHLPYIETAARITNDVLAVVDDLNGSIIETVF